MNSALLLALNTVALAALAAFHFAPANSQDPAQITQTVPHHLQQQQRPQLAVMTAASQSPIRLTQDAQATPTSEHWVF
ncbi:hypothetical protein [Pseudomonas sp. R5-89-07]|uniref:hypothetical protein n=1 Tax=Pseudomonas sp. R5-89-07 TaxID=658644 RepID=UPI000F577883|nr:hypothetical protein [Pseudomonas sp. R5-89-07]AZF06886.1 hypothetical protein C4J94_4142 [Pseudomonas sp. R5-89-07]